MAVSSDGYISIAVDGVVYLYFMTTNKQSANLVFTANREDPIADMQWHPS